VVETDVPTAELIKHASNAFLATRISFINQVARICERVGADVEVVAHGMGLDERIGPHFLQAGSATAGRASPRTWTRSSTSPRQVGEDFRLLEEVREINAGSARSCWTSCRDELWHLGARRS
jgi:UDPglucose 6-dehydrogenase